MDEVGVARRHPPAAILLLDKSKKRIDIATLGKLTITRRRGVGTQSASASDEPHGRHALHARI